MSIEQTQNHAKALELTHRLKKEMPFVYEQITFGIKPLIPSYALEDPKNPYWETQRYIKSIGNTCWNKYGCRNA